MLKTDTQIDQTHIWHPYESVLHPYKHPLVKSAKGVYLELEEGKMVIDGMSSWWSVIHGYNHPRLNEALRNQMEKMSHVMFGGLTHESAIELTKKLLTLLDDSFEYVFFADSGSVSVEVALKMALQYQVERGKKEKSKFLSFERGYHGDTFGAMSVCDPVTGMHSLFSDVLHKNFFAPAPKSEFTSNDATKDLEAVEAILQEHANEIAAIIIEPVVQGAGGMRFYSPVFLQGLRELANRYDTLLIFDEIATGFGRTGRMFAYEHAGVVPDIITLGKAITGGYMTLGATVTNQKVAQMIEQNGNVLMHGPTFMANPLACSVANASLELLMQNPPFAKIEKIQNQLKTELAKCEALPNVKEVRTLGAIGVVELTHRVDMKTATQSFLENGVWVRPFMNLIYIMPPFIIEEEELRALTDAIYKTAKLLQKSLK